MPRQTYVKNAAILTITGLFLRAVGMLFRIFIARSIGAEGMGLYQLVFSVYSMAITLATGGLTICATRIATDTLAHGKGTAVAMRRILILALCLGVGSGIILWLTAPIVSCTILVDMRAVASLYVLAPSLPFMAISAALRGYFIARRSVGPNARAQIGEQLIRIALVAAVFYFAPPDSTQSACACVLLGNTVSEGCSWIYMCLAYKKDINTLKSVSANTAAPKLLHILLPISANMYLTSFLRAIENVMVPACLAQYTLQRDIALAEYGALKGMAMPVIFFPFSFLGTLSTLLMPEIAEAFVRHNHKSLEYLVRRVMLITCVLSALAGCMFTCFASELGRILYQSDEIGFYIRVLGPMMPIMYLESMVDGVLKGMDEQLATFKYSLADSLLRIGLIAAILPSHGMKGFLFVMLVSNLFTGVLNVRKLLKVTGISFDWRQWALEPLIACLAAAAVLRFILQPLLYLHLPQLLWLLLATIICCAVYFATMWALGGFELKDIMPTTNTTSKCK